MLPDAGARGLGYPHPLEKAEAISVARDGRPRKRASTWVGVLIPLGVLVLIGAAAAVGHGIRELTDVARLTFTESTVVSAHLTDVWEQRYRKGTLYYTRYTFPVTGPTGVTRTIATTREITYQLFKRVQPGESVRVRVTRHPPYISDPLENRILQHLGLSFLGVVVLLTTLGVIFTTMVVKSQQLNLEARSHPD